MELRKIRQLIFKKNCVNIIPCVETSQKESETYQTKCLKVTNDPAQSSLKPTDQTCLPTDTRNHGEIDSQTGLEKESGTVPEKDNIITIDSSDDVY